MRFIQIYWVQISGAIAALFIAAKWHQSQRLEVRKSNIESIDNLSKYLNKPISDMSRNERFLLGEAIRNFYKGSRLSVDELAVLLDADDPNLAIECFLRYRFYLHVKDKKVLHKIGMLAKFKFLRLKIPFYKVQIKYFILYLFFASTAIFFIIVALNRIAQLDISSLVFAQSTVRRLLEILMSFIYSAISFIGAYVSLGRTDKPPSIRYISKVFSGVGN